jgi:hypothetical protein
MKNLSITEEDLENRFSFHPANTTGKQDYHASVRDTCLTAAKYLNAVCPEGREKSLAITKLEEVMFWANAAVARND